MGCVEYHSCTRSYYASDELCSVNSVALSYFNVQCMKYITYNFFNYRLYYVQVN